MKYLQSGKVAILSVLALALMAASEANAAIPDAIQDVFDSLVTDVPLYTAAGAGVLALVIAGVVGFKLAKKFIFKAT